MGHDGQQQGAAARLSAAGFDDEVRLGYFDPSVHEAAVRFYESEEWRAVRDWLPRGKGRVLDLGAGRGIASYAFARDGWDVTALEPDPSEALGAAAIRRLSRESGYAIDVVEEWGESLPFAAASFRVVYCRQVLHHADDLPGMCAEIARVLRPGGRLIATREHVISKPEDLALFLERHACQHMHGRENAFLTRDYLAAIRGGGLRLLGAYGVLESPVNYYPLPAEDRWSLCVAPLMRVFGFRVTRWLAGEQHRFGRRLVRGLARRAAARDDRPGRMYSFLAEK